MAINVARYLDAGDFVVEFARDAVADAVCRVLLVAFGSLILRNLRQLACNVQTNNTYVVVNKVLEHRRRAIFQNRDCGSGNCKHKGKAGDKGLHLGWSLASNQNMQTLRDLYSVALGIASLDCRVDLGGVKVSKEYELTDPFLFRDSVIKKQNVA